MSKKGSSTVYLSMASCVYNSMEPNDVDVDPPEKLLAENRKLKKELKSLVIEKNRMEDRLYRAVRKVLNTKKRKISALEAELARLKKKLKADDDGDVTTTTTTTGDDHCETCQCGSNRPRRNRHRIDDSGDEEMQDPSSCYGSDTDIDEDIDVPSSSTKTGSIDIATKQSPAVVDSAPSTPAAVKSASREKTGSTGCSKSNGSVATVKHEEKASEQTDPEKIANRKEEEVPSSGSETDYEMDDLVDEILNV